MKYSKSDRKFNYIAVVVTVLISMFNAKGADLQFIKSECEMELSENITNKTYCEMYCKITKVDSLIICEDDQLHGDFES